MSSVARPFVHIVADLSGVAPAQLRDASLLSGLLIAGAGGAGFTTVGPPLVRTLPNETVAGVLMLDGCHIALHSFPELELLLLDVLALGTHDGKKAVEVFTRRLLPRAVRVETLQRG
jgi:S-adenosylmethionine decarboxylase